MSCINDISYKILLSQTSLKESEKFIKDNSDAFFYVPSGFEIFGVKITGGNKIPIGIKNSNLLFQFIKPCTGIFVLEVSDANEEIEKIIRKMNKL